MVGDFGDDFLHPARHVDAVVAHVQRRGFLLHDVDFVVDGVRIVGADLRPVAILQRRDDAAAIGVVLWIRGGDQEDVQRHAHLVAANLHVAFFEDVEQPHLDPLGEVRQLVDGEDAAVHSGQQAEVERQLVVQAATFGDFDGVHLADEVGDGDVRRGELLAVALVARHPGDGRLVASLGDDCAPARGDGAERILGNLGAVDHRHFVVQKRRQAAHDPRLRLPPLAEQHDVLPAENGVGHLRNHGLVVADDAGEQRLAPPQLGDEIAPHLRLHRQHLVAGRPEFAEGFRLAHRPAIPSPTTQRLPPSVAVRRCRRNAATPPIRHNRPTRARIES